jgi:hypothetical protein
VLATVGCEDEQPGDAQAEFRAHAAAAGRQRTLITYSYEADNPVSFLVDLYLSGTAERFRADATFPGGDEVKVFVEGESEVWCSPDPSLLLDDLQSISSDGACTRDSTAFLNGVLLETIAPLLALREEYADVVITSGRQDTILDQRVDCFVAEFQGPPGLEYCFSRESRLLRVATIEAADGFAYTATAVDEASDTDFEPPYPIVEPD